MGGTLQRSSLSEPLEADQQLTDRLALHSAPYAANQLSQHICTTHTIKQASTRRTVCSLLQPGLHGLRDWLDVGRVACQLLTELLDNCDTNCTLRQAFLDHPKHLTRTDSHKAPDTHRLTQQESTLHQQCTEHSSIVHTCTSSAPSTADCAIEGIASRALAPADSLSATRVCQQVPAASTAH